MAGGDEQRADGIRIGAAAVRAEHRLSGSVAALRSTMMLLVADEYTAVSVL